MDPDLKPSQYSIDYLNQIAPAPQKPAVSGKLKWVITGLGGLAVIVLILMLVSLFSGQSNNNHVLAARLSQTAEIANGARKNLKSSQLRSYNSNLAIYLTNTNRAMNEHLVKIGSDPKKLDSGATAREATLAKEMTSALENARLNVEYDRVYSREMGARLETIVILLQSAYKDTNNDSYRQFLNESYKNLVPIQKQIAAFNEASS